MWFSSWKTMANTVLCRKLKTTSSSSFLPMHICLRLFKPATGFVRNVGLQEFRSSWSMHIQCPADGWY